MTSAVSICPKCKRPIVPAYGPIGGILIAGEFPGDEEMRRRIPFVGVTGNILRNELAQVGISLDACRLTNLWLHQMTSDMYDQPGHFEWHLAQLLQEMGQAKHILLMGSELAKVFLKARITNVCGLMLQSSYFPNGKKAMFCKNPAAAIHGTVGEIRLAIQKFGEECGVYNNASALR